MRRQILFSLLSCAAASLALAPKALADQVKAKTSAGQTQPRPIPPGMRLLNAQEGRAIVQGMAWADDEEGLAPDCSHLVHTLYEQAGYSYPYASSLDLYRGTGEFLRVRAPQPGDLIVWRGHVGIVVNPKEHSFFSSVSSGARTAYYDSPYWRGRGHARFYRYLTSSPAAKSRPSLEASNRPLERAPKASAQGDSHSTDERPALEAVKAPSAAATATRSAPPPRKVRSETEPAAATAPESSRDATRAENTPSIPLRITGKEPKVSDVTSAVEAANLDAGEILRAGDLERLERPVVVYRNLQVSGVAVKGKRGTAQVQLETLATISAERMEPQRGWEDHTLELQRVKKGWMMSPDAQNIYVPRAAAVRILAARLALLTQSEERGTAKDREQADIIRFLNLLIE